MNSSSTLILGSKSPRRQQLLRECGYDFKVITIDIDESFPSNIDSREVAKYIAKSKALAYQQNLNPGDVLLTADTVVRVENKVLGKPEDRQEAISMLSSLSSGKHMVTTAVCFCTKNNLRVFDATTNVYFRELTDDEIQYYVDEYKPFDKAGAYGIQEWIGMVGIDRIEGSYYNVMGLPLHLVYTELKKFV